MFGLGNSNDKIILRLTLKVKRSRSWGGMVTLKSNLDKFVIRLLKNYPYPTFFFVIMALEAKYGWTAENRTKKLIVEKL